MSQAPFTCPMSREAALDTYFLEHRAKLLDLAAFLDRIDRCRPAGPPHAEDYRLAAMHRAVAVLIDGAPHRARRAQEIFSDPTAEPIASAAGMKGAHGAWSGGPPR